jgi:hypothetical protein
MDVSIVGPITDIEIIAIGSGIPEVRRLRARTAPGAGVSSRVSLQSACQMAPSAKPKCIGTRRTASARKK